MANQQLVDYIKGQMMAGISEADIKKALKDAGWPDAEVEEGFKSAKGVIAQPAAKPAAGPVSAAGNLAGAASMSANEQAKSAKIETKTEPKKEAASFDFMSNPTGMSSASVFGGAPDAKDKEKVSVPGIPGETAVSPDLKSSRLPWIIAGVAILALLGGGVYVLVNGGSSSSQIPILTAQISGLTSQVADLKKSNSALSDQLSVLKSDAQEANLELNLFVAPSASGTQTQSAFALSGLIGGAKSQYTLTTSKGLLLYVKNSKDAKLDAALKPLVGATAQLSGTHVFGTLDITVTAVNGTSLAAASAATQATSTSKTPAGATSTLPGSGAVPPATP